MTTNNAAPDFSLSLVRSSNTLTNWRLRVEPPEKDDFMSQYLKHQYPIDPVYEQPVPLESVFKADARPGVIPALQCSHPYPHCESSCSSFKPEIEDIEIPEDSKANNVNAAHEFNFELQMKSFDPYEGLKDEFLDNPQWPLPPENPDFNSFYVFLPECEIVERNEFTTVKGESVENGDRHKRICPMKSVQVFKAVAESKKNDKNEDEGEEVDDWIPNTYTVGLFSKTHEIEAESDKNGVVPAPVARKPPNPIRRKDKGKEEITTVEDVLNMFAEPDPWRRMFEEDDDDIDTYRDYTDEYGYGYGGQWDPYEGEIGWDLWWGRRGETSTSAPDPVYESESEWNEDGEENLNDEDESEDARLFLRVYHDAKEDWEEEDESDDEYASNDSDSEVAEEQQDQIMEGLVWLSGRSMQALSMLKAQKSPSLKMSG